MVIAKTFFFRFLILISSIILNNSLNIYAKICLFGGIWSSFLSWGLVLSLMGWISDNQVSSTRV